MPYRDLHRAVNAVRRAVRVGIDIDRRAPGVAHGIRAAQSADGGDGEFLLVLKNALENFVHVRGEVFMYRELEYSLRFRPVRLELPYVHGDIAHIRRGFLGACKVRFVQRGLD